MYLEKLDIQGFKSFANRNVLSFPGIISKQRRGITSIVGPNGSGKSNIADAVRWALGEQSLKTLRGKKSEDVIFSGSDKKSSLAMAEVSLYLNNDDRKEVETTEETSFIDSLFSCPQIVLTRRVYRSGESEYLINNSRARLSDIQIFLAKANFGQKTYSVIGQGMVEGFLNTSLGERKDFFDEATGVKQYQIKRDLSLNKLENSYENLSQAEVLMNEIEPRLKSLTRQVHRLEKRSQIELELKDLQHKYYCRAWHEINDKLEVSNGELLELEKALISKNNRLQSLNHDFEKFTLDSESRSKTTELERKLISLQGDRESQINRLAKTEARLESALEQAGKFDLSFLHNRLRELKAGITELINSQQSLVSEEKNLTEQAAALTANNQALGKRIGELNLRMSELSADNSDGGLTEISARLQIVLTKLLAAENSDDLAGIKALLAIAREEIEAVLHTSRDQVRVQQIEVISSEISELSVKKDGLMSELGGVQIKLGTITEKLHASKTTVLQQEAEIKDINDRLAMQTGDFSEQAAMTLKSELSDVIVKINQEMEVIKTEINLINSGQDVRRTKLLDLQKEIQHLQNEINRLNAELSNCKIESARQETKLEDLEVEIREAEVELSVIRGQRIKVEFDVEETRTQISNLRRQLEQIGGIDPEVSGEYEKTKDRFEFLSTQTSDLSQTIKSLEKIITELDLIIKERFDREFKIISEKFSEYFKILFSGGHAKIIKVIASEDGNSTSKEGEELTEFTKDNPVLVQEASRIRYLKKFNATGLAGIEIEATPPGKKIKSISMLSGGERALTAIALICAIISANPAPFVVLDEVDAALDEANSERLAKILDDLSNRTQFIVITHNRASMRRASVLYGVTMQADGVSQLLSVKLEEN